MVGALFRLGEQKVRPNVYVRWYNDGEPTAAGGSTGIAAAVVKANWGPLNEIISIEKADEIDSKLGAGEGSEVVREIFRGGAGNILVVRIGAGGRPPETTLSEAVKLVAKYPTARQFHVTIRQALADNEKEFILYEGNKQLEHLVFTKGEDEVDNLIAAINTGSQFLTASKAGEGTELEAVTGASLSNGEAPAVTAESYLNGFTTVELKFFDGICVDSEDPIIHASLHAFVQRKLQEGFRVQTVIGEKISVPFSTRLTNARSFNDFIVTYVGNGFQTGAEVIDGAKAAARVLGMLVSSSYKTSLTKKAIQGSVGVYGSLTSSEYKVAAENGMLVFSESVSGMAQIDYGINTLITTDSQLDKGWAKIRRVKTRFELIDRISHTLANALQSEIDNNHDGRQYVITIANGIINNMIAEGGLESGQLIVDPDQQAFGDSAWFKFDNLVDLDGIEKLYIAFGFNY